MASSASMSEVHIRVLDESNLQTSPSQVTSSNTDTSTLGSDHSSVIQCQVCQVASSLFLAFFSSLTFPLDCFYKPSIKRIPWVKISLWPELSSTNTSCMYLKWLHLNISWTHFLIICFHGSNSKDGIKVFYTLSFHLTPRLTPFLYYIC